MGLVLVGGRMNANFSVHSSSICQFSPSTFLWAVNFEHAIFVKSRLPQICPSIESITSHCPTFACWLCECIKCQHYHSTTIERIILIKHKQHKPVELTFILCFSIINVVLLSKVSFESMCDVCGDTTLSSHLTFTFSFVLPFIDWIELIVELSHRKQQMTYSLHWDSSRSSISWYWPWFTAESKSACGFVMR